MSNFAIPVKPEIPKEIMDKWQRIVNIMARIVGVPAGLIMKIDPPQIEVFISSKTEKNPYHKGERANLNSGLYCETVMQKREPLLVSDATKDSNWDHNPDIPLGMIYYLGFPIEWPSGEIFGTICVLDYKDNPKAITYKDLIKEFKTVIETDLDNILKKYELEHEKERLRESEKKYRELVENANSIILKYDKEGNILSMNEYGLKFFGYKEEDLIGKKFIGLITPAIESTGRHLDDLLLEVFSDVEKHPQNINENIKKNGERVWVLWTNRPIKDENDNLIGLFSVGTDVTDRKKAEDNVQRLNETLRVLNKILRHDILNDLTVVMSACDMIQVDDQRLKQKASKAIMKSVSLIEQMRSLENALVSEEVLAGKSLGSIVESVVNNYPNIKFSIKGECTVLCDGAIYSAIDNIVRNAVVHGKTERIDISIHEKDAHCELRIADYGKGIPLDIKDKIFEEGESFGDTRGSGLGLYIVKKVIERYGGEISVEGNKPRGAVFVLKLKKA